MSRIRFGVVGCGAVSEIYHVPAIAHCAGATLTALADAVPERAAEVARRFNVPTSVGDHRELVGKVDAVLIATSNTTHADIACQLLEAGVHVLCEKPMATTSADADRMFSAAARSGARLMAGHSRRFNPNLELAKELVAAGRIGKLETVGAALGSPYGSWPTRTDFRRQRALSGGGVLLDLGIHLIDLAVWLGGGAKMLRYEASDTLGWGVENDAEVELELSNEACARLSCSYTHGLNRTVRLSGSAGWIETSIDGAPDVTFFGRDSRLCQRAGAQKIAVPETDPYTRQIEHYVDCLAHDRPFVVTAEQVVNGLDIIERCYAVARAA
ncbi:MAG: Gfo/Idh/MocA family oxidoreductase [Candidatus Binatia bacterium]